MKQNIKSRRGFTLLEVAIVIFIGGLITAMAATLMLNVMRQANIATTQMRMDAIDEAITRYQATNGVLPCAARLTDAPDTATFGVQVNADCTAVGAIPGTFRATGRSSRDIRIGAVPVRTLNLPDQYINDGWGNRFVYAVTEILTKTGSYDAANGAIYVVDSGNINPLSASNVALPAGSAHYVIISHGADEVGAYTSAGVAGATACPASTTASLEQVNCDFASPANPLRLRKTTLVGTKRGDQRLYDDYLTFHTATSGVLPAVPSGTISWFPDAIVPDGTCPLGWTFVADGSYGTTPSIDAHLCRRN